MNTSTVFDDLRQRIDASGASQNAIAGTLKIQQASISRFLAGKAGLQAEVFLKLLFFVGGAVIFGDKRFDDASSKQECDDLRKENDRLKQRILELEADVKAQQRLIDRAYPAPVSLSASEELSAG